MKTFIPKHKFNYIKKCLLDLNSAFRMCKDEKVMEVTKEYIQEKILSQFSELNEEQKAVLNISHIISPSHIDTYLISLDDYVYGICHISASDILKVFKKEKKIKIPESIDSKRKMVYLGWIDEASKKLFIIHPVNGKLVGMACRLPNTSSHGTEICALCHRPATKGQVAFVSPVCRNRDNYKSLGFYICLDSNSCNEHITSTEKLEDLLKKVNNIK